jgi:cytochrome oxidase assembly protein ShyY1
VYVVFIPRGWFPTRMGGNQDVYVMFIPRGWFPTRMGGNQDVYVMFIPRGWFPTRMGGNQDVYVMFIPRGWFPSSNAARNLETLSAQDSALPDRSPRPAVANDDWVRWKKRKSSEI